MDLNQIVATNLIELRKINNLTQQEFADAIGFSDKSISKWERGLAVPTVDILIKIANYYGLTVNDLISENAIEVYKSNHNKVGEESRKITITVLLVSVVWLIASAVYVNGLFREQPDMWIAFIYAIPVSSLVLTFILPRFWPGKLHRLVNASILEWSTTFTICLQFHLLGQPIWFLLIICIPLQIVTILFYQLRKK